MAKDFYLRQFRRHKLKERASKGLEAFITLFCNATF